jgi:hypothetical protein
MITLPQHFFPLQSNLRKIKSKLLEIDLQNLRRLCPGHLKHIGKMLGTVRIPSFTQPFFMVLEVIDQPSTRRIV